MVQYQSFPGSSGDSRTLDKLKALLLPDAAGAAFLDVGCNEGFFCGFAKFQGAERSVGIDHSPAFIKRAQQRFPDCEFHARSWDQLPEGKFDIILLASALHYADDQPALIRRLVDSLTPDGVLVLEMGIAKANRSAWINVKRGIDERSFPSMAKLREVLSDFAWKWMGPSIPQDGDPVQRHVVHVRRRRPLAYLLMEPPGLGKSTVAGHLFGATAVKLISNDAVMRQVAKGEVEASAELAAIIGADFSPFYLDRLIARVLEAGLIGELATLWCTQAGKDDFVMDGYIPAEQQALVQQILSGNGYLPVRLSWDRIGTPPPSAEAIQEEAERFYFSLGQQSTAGRGANFSPPAVVTGFVDEMSVREGQLAIRGWAVAPSGSMPRCLAVKFPEYIRLITVFERQQRPDVQRHFQLRHDLLGFRVSMDWPAGGAATFDDVQVFGGEDADSLVGPFVLASLATEPMP